MDIVKKDKILDFFNKNYILYFFSFIVAGIIVLLFQEPVSPLFDISGLDSMVFRIMGKGWIEGRLPYRDLFDHKGPVVYLINAIAAYINEGRIGLYLLSVLGLSFDLFLIHKLSVIFVDAKQCLFCDVAFIIFYLSVSEGGNLTEEWSLPFILLSVYLGFKFLSSSTPLNKHPFKYSFIYGFSGGIIFMIRPNNALPVLSVVIFYTILIIKNKDLKTLILNAIFVFFGFLLSTIPFIIYFFEKGILEEFIYAVFTFNFNYAKNSHYDRSIKFYFIFFLRTFYILTVIFFNFILFKRRILNKNLFLAIMCVTVPTSLSLFWGGGFLHYWLIDTTSYIFAVYLLFLFINKIGKCEKLEITNGYKNKKKSIVVILFFIGTLLFHSYATICNIIYSSIAYIEQVMKVDIKRNGIHKLPINYLNPSIEIINMIDDEDKNNVFIYNANDFYCTKKINIMPYNKCKYFVLQPYQGKFNNNISKSINEMMVITPPKYVVTQVNDILIEKSFAKHLKNEYIISFSNSMYSLWLSKSFITE